MNKSTALLCAGAACALTLSAAPAEAQTVTFGDSNPSTINDCTPGCTPILQTVYRGSRFGSSPVQIDSISFYLMSLATLTDTYTFTLSTSRNGVGSLSSVFANNVGADAQTFWSGTPTAGSTGAWVTFSGTPFVYDPTLGDLLLEIDHPGDTGTSSSDRFYSAYGSDHGAQRAYRFGGDYLDGTSHSIDTVFGVSAPPASGVPEPASWAMMVGGFGLVGGALRGRRASKILFA